MSKRLSADCGGGQPSLSGSTSGIVTLLTDFGGYDGYVAAMKGVILGLNPAAILVDVTHEIAPQDIRAAAFVLHTVHGFYPPRTVHLAVVDPGVGTERPAVILDAGTALFVAPDNGLLSYLVASGRGVAKQEIALVQDGGTISVDVPSGWRAVRIEEPRYWRENPSNTFHGRDIFAPVAAHLSRGEPVERFGPTVETLQAFEIPRPRRLPTGEVEGSVLHVDRFGNLISCLRAEDLPQGRFTIELGSYHIEGLSRSYAEGRGLTAIVGSSGYLEIALPNGSARAVTGMGVGAPVRVVPRHQ